MQRNFWTPGGTFNLCSCSAVSNKFIQQVNNETTSYHKNFTPQVMTNKLIAQTAQTSEV